MWVQYRLNIYPCVGSFTSLGTYTRNKDEFSVSSEIYIYIDIYIVLIYIYIFVQLCVCVCVCARV